MKWVKALSREKHELLVYSLSDGKSDSYSELSNVSLLQQNINRDSIRSDKLFNKLSYFSAASSLKKAIKEFNPDILHAHYASSYGLLGALSGFHPFVLSVWGSDVYEFPSNFIKRAILKYNLSKADKILSTSHAMVGQVNRYTSDQIEVIPFGIDVDDFKPIKVDSLFPEGSMVIGTVKALETIYGIDYLIKAFKLLVDNLPEVQLKLLIVGSGSKEKELKELVSSLGLDQHTVFTGSVPHDKVCHYLNMLDVYVALSIMESFGVAVLEASSCEIPVVVSHVGGLPEVVDDGSTGFVVNRRDENDAYNAINKLVNDSELRIRMGKSGRARVLEKYDWKVNVDNMLQVYHQIFSS